MGRKAREDKLSKQVNEEASTISEKQESLRASKGTGKKERGKLANYDANKHGKAGEGNRTTQGNTHARKQGKQAKHPAQKKYGKNRSKNCLYYKKPSNVKVIHH